MKLVLFTIFAAFSAAAVYEEADIKFARIESCRGCSLNRLPEVKQFVMVDAPKYERLEVKFISGASPELVLLGEKDVELERLALSQLNREQCNELLQAKGFQKIKNSEF